MAFAVVLWDLLTRRDLPLEQASAKHFVHTILRPVDAISVYAFSEVVQETTHGYVSDLKHVDDGIDHIRVGAATALYDAVYLASHDELAKEVGRKAMIILTDGEDQGSRLKIQEAIEAAQKSDSIVVFKIDQKTGNLTPTGKVLEVASPVCLKFLGVE